MPSPAASSPSTSRHPTSQHPRKRELVIYVHLSRQRRHGAVAGVENTRTAISVEQVKDWCAGTNTHVTVRPVIDLNENLATDSYRPTDLMREQAILTNATCVYPHCTRPSRTADLDHIENWDGTNTTSANLAPLCRGHHRYKTHGGWTVAPHRTHLLHLDQPLRVRLRLGHHAAHTRHMR